MMIRGFGVQLRRLLLWAGQCWLLFLAAILLPGCTTTTTGSGNRTEPLQVMVVATMHGGHADNARYSYDDLYALVEGFEPSLVAVEIRPEDMSAGDAYLARNYPLEMRELARRHAGRVAGIDWLGDDLEGRPVPKNYWREQSEIKQMERQLANESELPSPEMEAARARQSAILESATSAALNDGRYDRATADYYNAFALMVRGSRYQGLSEFYEERDRRIFENAAHLVSKRLDRSPDNRIVLVVGADHRGPLAHALKARFGAAIELVPVP